MRITRDQIIVGKPAAQLRDALRKVDVAHFYMDELAADLEMDAADLANQLAAEGYAEPAPDHNGMWRTTIQGNALVMAKLGAPYTRKAATSAVSKMLEAATQVNEGDYLFYVDRLDIFGSYLDDSVDRLGDVDVIVALSTRWTTPEEFKAGVERRCAATSRKFRLFHERLSWPEREVRKALKVSPILSFMDTTGVPEEWARTCAYQRNAVE